MRCCTAFAIATANVVVILTGIRECNVDSAHALLLTKVYPLLICIIMSISYATLMFRPFFMVSKVTDALKMSVRTSALSVCVRSNNILAKSYETSLDSVTRPCNSPRVITY